MNHQEQFLAALAAMGCEHEVLTDKGPGSLGRYFLLQGNTGSVTAVAVGWTVFMFKDDGTFNGITVED